MTRFIATLAWLMIIMSVFFFVSGYEGQSSSTTTATTTTSLLLASTSSSSSSSSSAAASSTTTSAAASSTTTSSASLLLSSSTSTSSSSMTTKSDTCYDGFRVYIPSTNSNFTLFAEPGNYYNSSAGWRTGLSYRYYGFTGSQYVLTVSLQGTPSYYYSASGTYAVDRDLISLQGNHTGTYSLNIKIGPNFTDSGVLFVGCAA